MLVDTRRIERFLDRPGLEGVPLVCRAASRSYRLHPLPQRDPADCLLIATAIEPGRPLVTYDMRIVCFGEAHSSQFRFTTAA